MARAGPGQSLNASGQAMGSMKIGDAAGRLIFQYQQMAQHDYPYMCVCACIYIYDMYVYIYMICIWYVYIYIKNMVDIIHKTHKVMMVTY